MTSTDRKISVNDHVVASDVVDGEAVIINLGNGMYYTMDKVGAELWQLFTQPRSVVEVAGILARRYEVAESEVARDVQDVVDELLREQLVIDTHVGATASASDNAATEAAAQPSYSKPVLVKYTDMSEVLALDPPLPALNTDVPGRS